MLTENKLGKNWLILSHVQTQGNQLLSHEILYNIRTVKPITFQGGIASQHAFNLITKIFGCIAENMRLISKVSRLVMNPELAFVDYRIVWNQKQLD